MKAPSPARRCAVAAALALAIIPKPAFAVYDCTTLKATACLLSDGDPIVAATVAVQLPKGLCSGTVLATVDGANSYQLILTAAHCLANPSDPAPASVVATTVYYRALGSCVTGNSALKSVSTAARSTVSENAELVLFDPPRNVLQSDGSTKAVGTDAAILRINRAAPRGVYFASWNAATLKLGGQSTTVGHGLGYQSTYARGTTEAGDSNSDKFSSFSTDGNTAGGHSGSGIYSAATGELVGQLSGGACRLAPAGTTDREGYSSNYGRFSSVYALAKSYLDPDNTGATSAIGYFAPSPPDLTFTVAGSSTSTSVTVGSPITFAWTASSDATSCLATGAWTGSKPTSGSSAGSVELGTKSYSLSCTNSSGTTTKTVTVTGTTPSSSGGTSSGGTSSGGSGAGGGGAGSLSILGLIPLLLCRRGNAHVRLKRPAQRPRTSVQTD